MQNLFDNTTHQAPLSHVKHVINQPGGQVGQDMLQERRHKPKHFFLCLANELDADNKELAIIGLKELAGDGIEMLAGFENGIFPKLSC